MGVKKKKVKDRAFIAVSPDVHNTLKKFLNGTGWGIGWFTEKALSEKMEAEIQKDKK